MFKLYERIHGQRRLLLLKKPAGFAQKPALRCRQGQSLDGSYLIGAVLGCGGFGITYIGMDLKSGSKVAVKEFMPHGLAGRNPGSLKICAKGQKRRPSSMA